MNTLSSVQLDRARRMLEHALPSPPDYYDASARLYQRVLQQLAPLIGTSAVHALFGRSVKQTRAAHPCIGTSFDPRRLAEFEASSRPPAVELAPLEPLPLRPEAVEALFGGFFSLLAEFIGTRLTAQVLDGAWPDLIAPAPMERKL